MIKLICLVMIHLSYGDGTVEVNLKGDYLGESNAHFIGDFSTDVKRLPIVGNADRYSNVSVVKEKCWKFKE